MADLLFRNAWESTKSLTLKRFKNVIFNRGMTAGKEREMQESFVLKAEVLKAVRQ